MHKKLIAIATALCCITTMGASISSVYAVGETSSSITAAADTDSVETHKINISLTGNLSSYQKRNTKLNLYDHFGTLRASYTGLELSNGITLEVPHYQITGENGDVWYVEAEVGGLDNENIIMTSAIGTNEKRTAIYMTQMENSIQNIEIWDANRGTLPSIPNKSYKLSADRVLSIREIGSLNFNIYDCFDNLVDTVTGAEILAGVSFKCKGYNKGLGRIVCTDTEIVKQNGWYIPPVEFNMDVDGSVTIQTYSSVPDNAEYDIPVKLTSFDMTDAQLSDTIFTIYDNSGYRKYSFSGKELASGASSAVVRLSKTEIPSRTNGNVWVIKGKYMGDSSNIIVPNVSFYANKTDTVEIVCGVQGTFLSSPVVKVPLKLNNDGLSDERLKQVEYTATDAFGKEVATWSGYDIANGNAYITWGPALKGFWTFTPKVLNNDKGIKCSPLTMSVEIMKPEMGITLKVWSEGADASSDEYGFVFANNRFSDYIESVMTRYNITATLTGPNGIKMMTITPDLLKNGYLPATMPKSVFDNLDSKKFTLVPNNVPSFLADTIKPIEIDLSDLPDKSPVLSVGIPWFDSDENFYREMTVNTAGESDILVYASTEDKNNEKYCAKNRCKVVKSTAFKASQGSCEIKVPIGTDVWFQDMTTHAAMNVDTTDSLNIISFMNLLSNYECYADIDGSKIYLGKGDSFLRKAGANTWLKDAPLATGYDGPIIAKVEDSNHDVHEYYWLPTDVECEPGILIEKEYCDNYEWHSLTRRKLDDFLVNRKSGRDAIEQTPTNWLIWDRNHDGKINVYDSIISKREYEKQHG